MSSGTVTSKGQITIPVEVRERLGLQSGTRVDFVPTSDGGVELHPHKRSLHELQGIVPDRPQPVSMAEMDQAVAEAASEAMR